MDSKKIAIVPGVTRQNSYIDCCHLQHQKKLEAFAAFLELTFGRIYEACVPIFIQFAPIQLKFGKENFYVGCYPDMFYGIDVGTNGEPAKVIKIRSYSANGTTYSSRIFSTYLRSLKVGLGACTIAVQVS